MHTSRNIRILDLVQTPENKDQHRDESLKYWLALLRTPGVGSKTFLKCLDYCPPEQLFAESHATLRKLALRDPSITAIKIQTGMLLNKIYYGSLKLTIIYYSIVMQITQGNCKK